LPCRRSWVRIPSAASRRPAFAGLFRWRSRLVRLHPAGLIPDSRPPIAGDFKEIGRLAGPILARPNRSHCAGLQEVEGSPGASPISVRIPEVDRSPSWRSRRNPVRSHPGWPPAHRPSRACRPFARSSTRNWRARLITIAVVRVGCWQQWVSRGADRARGLRASGSPSASAQTYGRTSTGHPRPATAADRHSPDGSNRRRGTSAC
jgi:hypothetical protein